MKALASLALKSLLPLLALVVVLAAAFWAGGERAEALASVRIQKLQTGNAERLAAVESRERQKEKEHATAVSDLRAEFLAQQSKDAVDADRERSGLLAGNQRLRLQVRACGVQRAPTGPADRPAPGADGPAPGEPPGPAEEAGPVFVAELAPATAVGLYDIVHDGDKAIEQLTALQSYVQTTLKVCQ